MTLIRRTWLSRLPILGVSLLRAGGRITWEIMVVALVLL